MVRVPVYDCCGNIVRWCTRDYTANWCERRQSYGYYNDRGCWVPVDDPYRTFPYEPRSSQYQPYQSQHYQHQPEPYASQPYQSQSDQHSDRYGSYRR